MTFIPARVILPDSKFASDFDPRGLRKGFGSALLLHALVFLSLLLILAPQDKNQLVLTEITMVEQIIPMPEPLAPSPAISKPAEIPRFAFPELLKKTAPIFQDPQPYMPKLQKTNPDLAEVSPALKLGEAKKLGDAGPLPEISDVGKKARDFAPAFMPGQASLKTRGLQEPVLSSSPGGINTNTRATGRFQDSALGNPSLQMKSARPRLAEIPAIKPPAQTQTKQPATAITIANYQGAFQIFGELQHREIIASTLPKYPRWAEVQGIEGTVVMQFSVAPDGRVLENIMVVQSSGHAELDRLAVQALETFVFARLYSSITQQGKIAFFFKLN